MWSTGCDNGGGDPNSQQWCPGTADTTLQEGDHWFYVPGEPIRSLAELIFVYHATVGRNAVLELDFAISRTGKVDPVHAARYKVSEGKRQGFALYHLMQLLSLAFFRSLGTGFAAATGSLSRTPRWWARRSPYP